MALEFILSTIFTIFLHGSVGGLFLPENLGCVAKSRGKIVVTLPDCQAVFSIFGRKPPGLRFRASADALG
ncbi:MAG: hypothetical protein LBF91_03635 [Azoarcus sp.]|jgi:hypothetical protein|nr:hypothetical protein [Azoarcus sp.]